MDIYTLNPYVRVAMHSVLRAGTRIQQRIIFDYELIYLERGRLTLRYAGIPYFCGAGQWLLLRPGIPHSFEDIQCDLSQPHVHFDMRYTPRSQEIPVSFKDLPQLTAEERLWISEDFLPSVSLSPLVSFSDPAHAVELLERIIEHHTGKQGLRAKAALLELLARLLSDNFPHCLEAQAEHAHDVSRQIKDWIDADPARPIDLNALEKQFSYSKYYLERKFKERYGISLIAYRNRQRLSLAKVLLASHSVSSVSEQLGFSSIYAFSRAFKNQYGIAPSEHKRLDSSAPTP